MPRKKFQQSKIQESDVTGLKYFDQLSPMLQRLHDDGCQRDTANNRELHYDQYCMLILLYLFNPETRNGDRSIYRFGPTHRSWF